MFDNWLLYKKKRGHDLKVHRELDWGISKTSLATKRKEPEDKLSKSDDELLDRTQEKWNRKRKPKNTFFSRQYIKTLKDRSEIITKIGQLY